MTARSGRELVWAVQVNDVLSADLLDLIGVGADIGTIAGAIHRRTDDKGWHRVCCSRCTTMDGFRELEGGTMNVGDMAPAFSLPGTTGPGLDLAELRGKGRAALFFYPADRTSG